MAEAFGLIHRHPRVKIFCLSADKLTFIKPFCERISTPFPDWFKINRTCFSTHQNFKFFVLKNHELAGRLCHPPPPLHPMWVPNLLVPKGLRLGNSQPLGQRTCPLLSKFSKSYHSSFVIPNTTCILAFVREWSSFKICSYFKSGVIKGGGTKIILSKS